MPISLAEATRKLLKGEQLAWEKFGDYRAGAIRLENPGQRRILKFLLNEDAARVAEGSETLFAGVIGAWNDDQFDPLSEGEALAAIHKKRTWRLERLEASSFGGLTMRGGKTFDLPINGENWCLEGQNGSGKTSLASAILWALTGRRVRDQDGPLIDRGERAPVFDSAGRQIGTWPPLASYPLQASDLAQRAEVWVRLTFRANDGATATAFRKATSPISGDPHLEGKVDAQLLASLQLIETGLLMPARLPRVGFGAKSQSLYEAVKLLTGLDQLADIAEGCSAISNAGRRFLKYARDHSIEVHQTLYNNSIVAAEQRANEVEFALPQPRKLGANDLTQRLRETAAKASSDAGNQLAILKSEIAATLSTDSSQDRVKVKKAVDAARHVVGQGAKGIAIFEAWKALTDGKADDGMKALADALSAAAEQLDKALAWHVRQLADKKLRLKALAAQIFVPSTTEVASECPLCDTPLDTDSKRALAEELEQLQVDARLAEAKIEDVCNSTKASLSSRLPAAVNRHRETLDTMNPRDAYLVVARQRFCEDATFKDVLVGFVTIVADLAGKQLVSLPDFAFSEFEPNGAEPQCVQEARREVHLLRRLLALVEWWSGNRELFVKAWSDLLGKADPNGGFSIATVEGQLLRLEEAFAKAQPLDEISRHLTLAADAADKWNAIRREQAQREAIAAAIEPLKDLRFLVGAETARSIATLSGKMKLILDRIRLRERLAYEDTAVAKKAVRVYGSFEPDMQIDAALVANSSWLRAILWAFIFAMREQTVESLGYNPLPLMVLDDPQVTFDARNKRKWAQEIVRNANMGSTDPLGLQLILTTHERQFYQYLVDHEHLKGELGIIGAVSKAVGVATVVTGGCLARVWNEAITTNSDARARDYVADVRTYCEDLLKSMLRVQGAHVSGYSLDKLAKELEKLHDSQVRPFDRKPFKTLLDTIQGGGGKEMKLINEAHHKDDETIGLAEASDVKRFWEEKLFRQIHDAFRVHDNFESFYGDPRTFPWARNVIEFPVGHREDVKSLKMQQTGVAAAAKSDGRVGDGVITVEEWKSGTAIYLPNHEVYQLAADTLEPVAAVGDLLVVSNYAKVHARNLVVAAHEDLLLARRFNQVEGHPQIAVLTGQAIDPYRIAAPVIVDPDQTRMKKIVGTLFTARKMTIPPHDEKREIVQLPDAHIIRQTLDCTRAFEVRGRSAEPVALQGQFLITREPISAQSQIRKLDGHLVVAVDESGARYFKRLQCRDSLAILESLNPDGTTAAELLSFDGALGYPQLTQVLEVVGVLFELPDISKAAA